jgi:hypothetical protein
VATPANDAPPQVSRRLVDQTRTLVHAIQAGDDDLVVSAVVGLRRKSRVFAPLGMLIGALTMLFMGVKLLFSNWRLTLIELLPASWIWLAMVDLKAHLFQGRNFHPVHGWALVVGISVVTLITMGAMYLNAVFAFAIVRRGRADIAAGFAGARAHAASVLAYGAVIGVLLGFAALYSSRWGVRWFTLCLGIVIAIMMVAYIAIPSRMVGLRQAPTSRSEAFKASVVGGVLSVIVCSPPYLIGRLGILLLGVRSLLVVGIILLVIGLALEAGATSAVKAVKMSAKLLASSAPDAGDVGRSGTVEQA